MENRAGGSTVRPEFKVREENCQKKVLVVEDDRAIRETLSEILSDNDYTTMVAANGQVALDELHATDVKPCLILLDVMMPVMDGWRFREVQRSDPELSAIPVVVLTAHASVNEVVNRMSAEAVLRKPIDLDDLIVLVGRYCDTPAA